MKKDLKQTNQGKSERKKLPFFISWILCIVSSWAILPYAKYLGIAPPSFSFIKMLLLSTVHSILFYGVACWLSYLLVPRTDLSPFSIDRPAKRIIYPGIIVGLAVGIIIYLFDITLFKSSLFSKIHPPIWAGFFASFYGAVNEEVLLRLFLFTLVYFLFKKIFKFEKNNKLLFLWVTNLIVAVIFGLGHLPVAFKLGSPSSFEIFRIFLLNGIPSIAFGWLYWTRGLWTAMAAHFVADLVIHVFLA